MRESALAPHLCHPLVGTITTLLDRGMELGVFRDGIDVLDLYVSITALPAYYLDHQHTLGAIFDIKLMTPARIKRRLEHSADMIGHYPKA